MTTENTYESYDTHGNLTTCQRQSRAVAAIIMLVYPMITAASPLGLVALLPLIAIYPMFTAIVGWDPIRYVLANANEEQGVSQTVARTGLVIVGTGLIGATMVTSVYPLGGLAVLALLGILPIFVAIFGENPVSALFESGRTGLESGSEIDQGQESDHATPVDYAANEARFSAKKAPRDTHHEAA